jgi:hypothetical protein
MIQRPNYFDICCLLFNFPFFCKSTGNVELAKKSHQEYQREFVIFNGY